MDSVRKIFGVLIIVFIALPILFGIVWAVGVTKAVVSPEFLSDMPREMIEKVPSMVDEMLETMQEEDFPRNENERAWIKAIKDADTSPKELMAEIGLLDWLENELSTSFRDIGEILRGNMEPKRITLNLRPLKKALQHKAIETYIMSLVRNFPPCDVDDLETWRRSDPGDDLFGSLPACQPDPLIVTEALAEWRSDIEKDIDDEVEIFQDAHLVPKGLRTARTVVSLTYLLFFIPAIFIALGALVGASTKQGFLQWTGISTIIGGLLPLGLALFIKKIVPLAMEWAPYEHHHWAWTSTRFQELVIEKLGGLSAILVEQLFSPVIAVAGVVCVVGIILYALSYLIQPTHPVTTNATPQQPGPTNVPPTPVSPTNSNASNQAVVKTGTPGDQEE